MDKGEEVKPLVGTTADVSNGSQGSGEGNGLEQEEEEEQVEKPVAVVATVRSVRKELSIPSERLFLCCFGDEAKEWRPKEGGGSDHSCRASSMENALSLVEIVSSKEVSLSSRYSSGSWPSCCSCSYPSRAFWRAFWSFVSCEALRL